MAEQAHHENKEDFLRSISTLESKESFYCKLLMEAKGLLEGERDWVANTANIASLLFNSLNTRRSDLVNWAGFYIMRKGELVLGPFMGKPACIRIKLGKGVCGTAAKTQSTQVVADVHKFPGHIACDSASNSEIVVPLILSGANGNLVVGVLDIDSAHLNSFDEDDRRHLEDLGKLVTSGSDWPSEN
eukprot:TRINITY_DN12370_c0_g1_i1.p1 TRINITY_DN12370_c0_g1~~TRINITY_DN12370_c0_g1_i1.p1  ORF type:complete len:201 (+),score=38.44 TRINITY_DN12370_c0_g1_i1:44-604(+)